MTLNAKGYFEHLFDYLNTNVYATLPKGNKLELEEVLDTPNGKEKLKVRLTFKGEAFAIKLDKDNIPLFRFLDNDGRSWAKRCDFVVFHRTGNSVKAHCIEFKSRSIKADDIKMQLDAGEAWCRSLNNVLKNYKYQTRKMQVRKYVFTLNTNPSAYLDPTDCYLVKDPSIRHYHYDDVDGIALEDLENRSHVTV